MNKKSQIAGLGFSIVVAIMIFMIGMMVVNFLKTDITTARTGMSCSDSTISDASKLTCLAIDIVVPYFIVLVISISGGFITNKFVTG